MEGQGKQTKLCKACGQPVTGDTLPNEHDEIFCRQCAMEQLERDLLQSSAEVAHLKNARSTRTWRIAVIVFAIFGMGLMAYQTPKLLQAFKDPKLVRMGTYETDEATDRCIKNLWQQAYLIQQGRPDDARRMVCPATGKPYVFTQGLHPEVHCPNPDRHGFRDILITQKNPVPELRR